MFCVILKDISKKNKKNTFLKSLFNFDSYFNFSQKEKIQRKIFEIDKIN